MQHKHLFTTAIATMLLLAGCSKDPAADTGIAGYGRIALACEADLSLATRAQTVTTPATADFAVTITGPDYQKSWSSMEKYEAESPLLKEGSYTIVVSYGDPETEGVEKPYYTGSTTAEVVARKTTQASVTARIANSLTTVETTEQFRKYFHGAAFTLKSASGGEFHFAAESAENMLPLGELVYVKVGTTLTLSGTARHQSQTGIDEGPAVNFQEQTLPTTEAKTCHRFRFDAPDAGSATLDILIDDTVVETIALPIELNEGAKQ